jgi:hypothetical protein
MPRLPGYVAQGGIEGAVGRQPMLDPAAAAAPAAALAETAQGLSRQTLRFHDAVALANERQRKVEADLDIKAAMNEASLAIRSRENELLQQGIDPESYEQTITKEFDGLAKSVRSRFKHPEYVGLLDLELQKLRGSRLIEAQTTATKVRHNLIEAKVGEELTTNARLAVHGPTPLVRRQAFNDGLDRINQLVTQRIYSGDQAAARQGAFLKDVEGGGIERDFRNPEFRGQVIEKLQSGGYARHSNVEQAALARRLVSEDHAQQRWEREERERYWTDGKRDAMRDLRLQIIGRELPSEVLVAKLRGVAETWRLQDTEVDRLYDAITADPKEAPSDRDVADDITARIAAAVDGGGPATSLDDLHRLRDAHKRGQPGLSAKDYTRMIDRYEHAIRLNRAEANTEHARRRQEFSDARSLMRERLGIPPLYERLDPVTKRAWGDSLDELMRRSLEGTERAQDVAREILPRALRRVGEQAITRVDEIEKGLKYRTPAELQAAWRAGQITERDYDYQQKLFLDLKEQVHRLDQQSAQKSFSQPGQEIPGDDGLWNRAKDRVKAWRELLFNGPSLKDQGRRP